MTAPVLPPSPSPHISRVAPRSCSPPLTLPQRAPSPYVWLMDTHPEGPESLKKAVEVLSRFPGLEASKNAIRVMGQAPGKVVGAVGGAGTR